MTKRGSQDNVVTYEHYCDTKADLNNIPQDKITLGSVAIVLKDENNEMGIYIANSNKEWNSFSSGGSSAEEIELEELTITENGTYSAGAGKGFSKVTAQVEGEQLGNYDVVCRRSSGPYFNGMLTEKPSGSDTTKSSFMSKVTHVHLGSAITSIDGEAMTGSSSLVSIQGEGVEQVNERSFAQCTALQSVDFPNLTTIYKNAFGGCTNLVSFNFGKVSDIRESAFGGCVKLASSVIVANSANRVGNIEKYAFYACSSIKEVYLTNTLVGVSAFGGCSGIEKLLVKEAENPTPYDIIIIYPSAFGGCSGLEKAIIDINGDIKYTYGNYNGGAFGGCTHLTDLYLGSHISNIEAGSFGGVPITCKVRCGFSEGSISGFPENAGFAGNIADLDIEYDVPYPDEDAFFAD